MSARSTAGMAKACHRHMATDLASVFRQPPVGARDCYERERTDLAVGGVERRAVSVEDLAEALCIQGGVAEAGNQCGNDLRSDPTRVVLEKPEESPTLEERGKG